VNPAGGPILLAIARLIRCKGIQELIGAMPPLLEKHRNLRVLIAGEGPERSELERKIAALKLQESVVLLGRRGDVPTLLAASDIFVHPSHYEGLPGALIEAMFAARPIVATDTPEHRECVTHGQSARLVAAGDSVALAEGIGWLLDHPAEAAAMGEQARRAAMERFDVSDVARDYERVYEELLLKTRAVV
jgi:glycosyltransferase involved in cell wall biosynthesis